MVAAVESHSGSSSLALCVIGGGGEGASSSAALFSQSGSSESCDSLPCSERGDASPDDHAFSGGVDTRLLKNMHSARVNGVSCRGVEACFDTR